jgi:class 3 adenylate cyclase
MNARRLSGLLFAICLVLTMVGLVLVVATLSTPRPGTDFGFPGFSAVFALTFATVGWLVTARQPQTRLGRLFVTVGLLTSVQLLAEGYASYGVLAHPGSLPGADWAAWLYAWIWFPAVAIAGFFILLLFPDGQLPSPRWRPVAWAGGVVATVFTILTAFGPGPLSSFSFMENPAGLDFLPRSDQTSAATVFLLGMSAMFVTSALSLVLRYRHASGATRQQLRWIAFAGAIFAVLIIPTQLAVGSDAALAKFFQVLLILSIAGIPAAAGIAILRYRLYDLDLLINRTVLYGGVTLGLAAVFGLAYLVLQQVVESVTGQRSELVTVGLVAAAALLYGPIRRRAAPLVDRLLPARAEMTLMFTDIVGSTARIVELGDERWRALLDRYRAAVRAELSRYGGREVNTAGDAFFAVFDRPVPAIHCAEAIRVALGGLDLECRTGLHLGLVELRGEQVSGLAVHASARVMSEAEPGEILVSDSLRAVVADDLALVDRGQHELKGLPGEWQLFALAGPESAT